MPTIVSCSSCQRQLRVPDNLLGKLVKCPSCGFTFTASPDEEAGPPEERPASAAYEGPSYEEAPPEEEEVRPRRRPRPARRYEDDYEEEYDYEERPRRRRRDEKPGKVQAIAIMTLIGGILALITGIGWMIAGVSTLGICCLWPGGYYSLVLGIMATIRGSQMLGQDAHRQPPPKGIAIMQIINIINGDIANCVMGILTLVFLNEREVQRFFRG